MALPGPKTDYAARPIAVPADRALSAAEWEGVMGRLKGAPASVFEWIPPVNHAAVLAGAPAAGLTAYLQSALDSGAPVVDGGPGTYVVASSLTIPAGVEFRANLVAGVAGMNVVLVSTGSKFKGKIVGTGTTSIIERAVYPATDGASDVELDVEVSNLTVGVHAQPLSSLVPKRWRGRIYAHDIVGTTGASEGYALLLSPAESCQFLLIAKDVKRHPLYYSAGARYNDVYMDVEGCGNVAAQFYSLPEQPATRQNTVRGKVRGLYVPAGQAAGQAVGAYIVANAHQNTVSIDVEGGGTAEHAVVVEGTGAAGVVLPTSNRIVGCQVSGEFIGAEVVKDLNGEATEYNGNSLHAFATHSVIALRRTGTPTITRGPSVEDNHIDAQGQSIRGVYDEVTAAPTHIGRNVILNHGTALAVEDATEGKRSGWLKEYVGRAIVAGETADGATGAVAVTWPETVLNPRLEVCVSSSGSVGLSGAWASSTTGTGAVLHFRNESGNPQTNVTLDWSVRGD